MPLNQLAEALKSNPINFVSTRKVAGVRENAKFSMFLMNFNRANKMAGSSFNMATGEAEGHMAIRAPLCCAPALGADGKLEVNPPAIDGLDTGVRYLPYQENKAFCLKLDETGSAFITAELTGCDFYVFGDRKAPWVAHVNYNAGAAQSAAAGSVEKLRMARKAIIAESGDLPNKTGAFTRADYKDVPYQAAFVLGNRNDGGWTFYSILKTGTGYSYDVINP